MGKPDGRKGSKHGPSEEVSVIFAVEPTGPQLLNQKWDGMYSKLFVPAVMLHASHFI